MALLLVRTIDNTHADESRDIRGTWKAGDIVQVLPDTAFDGDTQKNPIAEGFALIKVNRAEALLQQYVGPAKITLKREEVTMRRLNGRIVATRQSVDDVQPVVRSRYSISLDGLPASRYVEITAAQLLARLTDKSTLVDIE